jgi:hypothetical protein
MSFETSVPGVFAAGDVRFGSTKRVATAVGESAGAVQNIHQYIEDGLRAVRGKRQTPAAQRIEASVASADTTNAMTQPSNGTSALAILADVVAPASRAEASAAGRSTGRRAASEAG